MYISYRGSGYYYVHPFSYDAETLNDNGYSRFYENLRGVVSEDKDLGTIKDVSSTTENGTDIDYFAKTHGAVAIQAYLSGIHIPQPVDDILAEHYAVFQHMFSRSSNLFVKEHAHTAKVYPCGSECSPNGIVVIELWINLIYTSVADSEELFMEFDFT